MLENNRVYYKQWHEINHIAKGGNKTNNDITLMMKTEGVKSDKSIYTSKIKGWWKYVLMSV